MEIKEIRFEGKNPSIGYTDYINIYISNSITGKDLETLRKHEKSHIWLQHYTRGLQLNKNFDLNHELWNIACDLEIAKYIYNKEDNSNILKPFSFLTGGITINDSNKYPNCEFAEDYYLELLQKGTNKLKSFDLGNKKINEKSESNIEINMLSLIESALKKIKDIENQENITKVQSLYNNFKPSKPSMYSEIDKYLGRSKIKRESSYKRPKRYNDNEDLFKKGKKSILKTANITIYIDRSGSFNQNKTKLANEKLNKVLQKYRGSIKKDVVYFNDILFNIDPINGFGGTNYSVVIEDIVKNRSLLSIIITDNDSCNLKNYKNLPHILIIRIDCNKTWLSEKLNITDVE
jgi:predicted metal-dependent peptidase